MTTATNSPAVPAAHEEELPETAVSERAKARTIRQLHAQVPEEPVDDPEPSTTLTAEEATWKQRYADLRRHVQTKETAMNKKVQELATQLEQLTAAQAKPMPKTKEEFEKWKAEYPDIVPFIEQIAEEKANERSSSLKSELDSVKSQLETTEQEKAFALLKVLVPDVEEIPAMPEYAQWLNSLSPAVKERVLASDDPYEVRDYMNMFKATLDKPVRPADKSAAVKVLDASVKHSGSNIPRNATKYKFKESDLQKMSPVEYAEKEAEIDAANRAGLVLMDITGKATYHTDI